MSEFENMNVRGYVARVRFIDEDAAVVHVELENNKGIVVTLEDCDLYDIEVGSVVFLRDNQIDPAPEELWTGPAWVGVVRHKGSQKTVISRSGSGEWVAVPTRADVPYDVGNTVEANDSLGVLEVLAEEPLRSFDFAREEIDVSRFKVQDGPDEGPTFEHFGGMEDVVERARDLIEVPLKYKEALSEIGARPIKGVLFTGPPGTGKTMLARIIAGEAKSAFYKISGPEVFTKWFGESEETLREIFDAAAAAEEGSAIIFFDEIDSVASARDSSSHEASRRVVAQLLTQMDGFKLNTNVIVIAATNRPDDIDPALRRPGRFDWQIDFHPPDEKDREAILRASGRPLKTEDDLPHADIARNTHTWSAADLAAIWSEAALIAAKDERRKISDEDYRIGFERVQEQRRRTTPTQVRNEGA
jgi:transitional endoplasmic reticulum ATPase